MSSPLLGKRVAYVPYSQAMSGPGDRRRFVHYAKLRGVPFELPRAGAQYDVVVLSSLADITAWSRLPRGATRVVYELVDSYLDSSPFEPRALVRGAAKFLLRHHRHFEPSYHDSLRRMFRRADAVICSTPEQQRKISLENRNTYPILDFHSDPMEKRKSDYARGPVFKLLWEGLPQNLITFSSIAGVLREFARVHPVMLHLVTNLTYPLANGPLPSLSTQRLIDRHLSGVECALHQWTPQTLGMVGTACDLALIPMIDSPIYQGKPENKLLLLWHLGIPVLTAATPAYVRVMKAAGLEMSCRTEHEWRAGLERMLDNEAERRLGAQNGREFTAREHSEARLVEKWDAMFESILERGVVSAAKQP